MPERDEHYWKYRVFYEPEKTQDPNIGHPVPMVAQFLTKETPDYEDWVEATEVDGLFFVLRPEGDHYARVAMASYAYACRREFPTLAADIIMMIEALEWEEETGQHRDDFPLDREDVQNYDYGKVVEMFTNKAESKDGKEQS